MKSRGPEIHGILLIAALGAAWMTWTSDDKPVKQGEVSIWDLGKKDVVTSVRWEAEGRTVVLERKKDEFGTYVWGRTDRERKPRKKATPSSQPASKKGDDKKDDAKKDDAKKDDAKAAGSEGEGEGEGEEKPETVEIDTKVFLANDKAIELFEKFANPQAKRSLGPPTEDQLEELKLKEPEGKVIVFAGDKTKTLEVGMMAYGGGLRYVRDPAAGVAYVVEAKLVDDLKWADSRLVERALHTFKADDVKTFTVTTKGATKTFTRETDDTAKTWLGKLFRLRADRYVAPDDKLHNLEGDVPEVEVLKAEFQTTEGASGQILLTRFGEGTDARFYAVTERSKGRVGVSRYQADEVSKDLDGLFPSESVSDDAPPDDDEADPDKKP